MLAQSTIDHSRLVGVMAEALAAPLCRAPATTTPRDGEICFQNGLPQKPQHGLQLETAALAPHHSHMRFQVRLPLAGFRPWRTGWQRI